jgi:tRNA(fMet)-specific endonuclease VapC
VVSGRYLLDANVISEKIRPLPNPRTIERLNAHPDRLTTAAPVWQELVFGYQRLPASRRRRNIERYLTHIVRVTIPILPYDQAAAEWHAAERARLVGIGRTPPFVDGQIAAIAATNGLILVTANVGDFQAFNNLQVEDWRS